VRNATEVHFDQIDRTLKEINFSFLTIHHHRSQNRMRQAFSKDPNDRFFSPQSSRLLTKHNVSTRGTEQNAAQCET